ncbi:RloG protein, partial [Campylobacter coli]|nr:RloG protein [Campylobacter coli]EKA9796844.1 hypothetical protein [Campylobacter jejuni]
SIEEIEENPHFTKYNANNLKNIFAPVTINQNTFFINHKGEELLRINSDEAELIYENANYICEKKEIEYQKIHENALITMYKTTNKIDNKTKHKAKCDALSPYAVDVSFSDEKIAEEVLKNPYGFNFLVDLEYYKNDKNKIILYRIFNIKDKISLE